MLFVLISVSLCGVLFAGCLTHSENIQYKNELRIENKTQDVLQNLTEDITSLSQTKLVLLPTNQLNNGIISGISYSQDNKGLILEGTANLRPGRRLIITIEDPYFGPENKMAVKEYYGVSGVAVVQKKNNSERNYWNISFPGKSLPLSTYLLTIESPGINKVKSELIVKKI